MSAVTSMVDVMATVPDDFEFRFVSTKQTRRFGDLRCRGLEAMAGLRSGASAVGDAAVGVVLDNSPEAIALVVGATLCGVELVSFKPPARGLHPTAYLAFLRRSVEAAAVGAVALPDGYADFVGRQLGTVPVREFGEVIAAGDGGARRESSGFVLTQFSSGTTGDPKPCSIADADLAANVDAVLDRLGVGPDDSAVSWLPLSHDMGLVGMLFSALASSASRGGRAMMSILDPTDYQRRPERWVDEIAAVGATVTAAPPSAMARVLRSDLARSADLSTVRAWLIGAEPIDPVLLERFAHEMRPSGLRSQALCPAYGMAEVGIAASISAPDEEPRCSPDGATVSCGHPVRGIEVAARPDGGLSIGRLVHRAGGRTAQWFDTGDVGAVHDGEVHAAGRVDDLVFLAGRKVALVAVDRALAHLDTDGVSAAAAFQSADGSLSVCLERRDRTARSAQGDASDGPLAVRVREIVAREVGEAVHDVFVLPRGTFPATASGKTQRHLLARRCHDEGARI